jgi:hypothetical protein
MGNYLWVDTQGNKGTSNFFLCIECNCNILYTSVFRFNKSQQNTKALPGELQLSFKSAEDHHVSVSNHFYHNNNFNIFMVSYLFVLMKNIYENDFVK